MTSITSLAIHYNGSKRIAKVASPSQLLQSILTETAEYFQMEPKNCSLRHKKTILDPSQPIRFLTLPNNAQIELIVNSPNTSSPATSSLAAVKLLIGISATGPSIPLVGSVCVSLDSGMSLSEVVSYLQDEGKLAKSLVGLEVIYMRSPFNTSDSLRATTLASLGLSGQSTRLQIRYISSEEGILPSPPSDSSSVTQSLNTTVKSTHEVFPEEASAPMDISPPSDHRSIEKLPISTSSSQYVTAEVVNRKQDFEQVVTNSSEAVSPPKIGEAVSQILSSNFDRDSISGLCVLLKYLCNICSTGNTHEKYRMINTKNKIYLDKVAAMKNTAMLIEAMGFRSSDGGTTFRYHPTGIDQAVEGARAIDAALDELNVPREDRATYNLDLSSLPLTNIEASSSATATASATKIEFDPYKPMVIRNSIQPPRESKAESATERQLEELRRRRAELEGNPQDVQRNTKVLLPSQSYATQPDSKSETEDTIGPTFLPKSLVQKLLKKDDESEAPLTTRAVRELTKLQNEKVYNQTVIRIRFPDQLQLVGTFHPRHTLVDVYLWISEALQLTYSSGVDKDDISTRLKTVYDLIELFTTPPKTILSPYTVPFTNGRRIGNLEISSIDLSGLGLVPAATIQLAWKKPELFQTSGYLREGLLSITDSSTLNVPSSQPLVASKAKVVGSPTDLQADSKELPIGASGIPDKSKSSKPKWFKL